MWPEIDISVTAAPMKINKKYKERFVLLATIKKMYRLTSKHTDRPTTSSIGLLGSISQHYRIALLERPGKRGWPLRVVTLRCRINVPPLLLENSKKFPKIDEILTLKLKYFEEKCNSEETPRLKSFQMLFCALWTYFYTPVYLPYQNPL